MRWEMRCGDGEWRRGVGKQVPGYSLSSGTYHSHLTLQNCQSLECITDHGVVDIRGIGRFLTDHDHPKTISQITDASWHGRSKPLPQPSPTRRTYAEEGEASGEYGGNGGYGDGEYDMCKEYLTDMGLRYAAIILAVHGCLLACAEVMSAIGHRIVTGCGRGRGGISPGHHETANDKVRPGRARHCGSKRCKRSRTAIGDPWIRPRARCRAYVIIYLLASGDAFHAAAGRHLGKLGTCRTLLDGHPRAFHGSEGWPTGSCDANCDTGDVEFGLPVNSGCVQVGDSTQCSEVRWWTDASRVGEASTPGPLSATIAADGMLRKIYSTARSALCYPALGTNALGRVIAPGFPTSNCRTRVTRTLP